MTPAANRLRRLAFLRSVHTPGVVVSITCNVDRRPGPHSAIFVGRLPSGRVRVDCHGADGGVRHLITDESNIHIPDHYTWDVL